MADDDKSVHEKNWAAWGNPFLTLAISFATGVVALLAYLSPTLTNIDKTIEGCFRFVVTAVGGVGTAVGTAVGGVGTAVAAAATTIGTAITSAATTIVAAIPPSPPPQDPGLADRVRSLEEAGRILREELETLQRDVDEGRCRCAVAPVAPVVTNSISPVAVVMDFPPASGPSPIPRASRLPKPKF